MENTIDNFFNEIDQIAPPKDSSKESCDWQECFDSSSGFSYYWNVKTNQVTWNVPIEYKLWKQENPNHDSVTTQKPNITPLFPSALPTSTKIYKLESDATNLTNNKQDVNITKKVLPNRPIGTDKVVLIPSYGEGSDSETEVDKEVKSEMVNSHLVPNKLKENCNLQSTNNSEEDDMDLLTKLQSQAKILKDLGGELPPDVKKIVEQNDSFAPKEVHSKIKNEVSGFSLVAGYGESDEEDDGNFKMADTSLTCETKPSCSTLFPTLKPIDVKQFVESEKEPETESIDAKAFHRKRRIGIDFSLEKFKPDVGSAEIGRQGLGFKSESSSDSNSKTKINYPGFQSGGLIFVKSDVLNPVNEVEKKEAEPDISKAETMKKIEETHKTLNEKLTFLSEGRDPVSSVQVIIIQMQTLYEAMQAGSLTVTYLYKWLKETCSELVKLEKDAAPNGWLLQWDRINKRYYYRNQQTGESQWQYPEPDIVGGDEAMDICTTPPPTVAESIINEPALPIPSTPMLVRPPPPPRIKSPSPPPPPIISKNVKHRKKAKSIKNIDITQELPPLPNAEPLPPGVDALPQSSLKQESFKKDSLGSELNSFYSDLAAMEMVVGNGDSEISTNTDSVLNISTSNNAIKKKKKPKVKLVEGLAMKKKGVSKLVERWKNVQKDYN